jgi:hypothetical protein
MITGCYQDHLEETPLCTKHLNYWIKCHNNNTLICDVCKTPVTEYDYCSIRRVTPEWSDNYIKTRLIEELVTQNRIIAPTPKYPPINPSGWLNATGTKHTNPPRPPGF